MACAFQSHAGSIEAGVRAFVVAEEHACFNPTLVRLRRFSRTLDVFSQDGFNPTLVRLRPKRIE